jgi:hypothetical protein
MDTWRRASDTLIGTIVVRRRVLLGRFSGTKEARGPDL